MKRLKVSLTPFTVIVSRDVPHIMHLHFFFECPKSEICLTIVTIVKTSTFAKDFPAKALLFLWFLLQPRSFRLLSTHKWTFVQRITQTHLKCFNLKLSKVVHEYFSYKKCFSIGNERLYRLYRAICRIGKTIWAFIWVFSWSDLLSMKVHHEVVNWKKEGRSVGERRKSNSSATGPLTGKALDDFSLWFSL